MKKIEVLNKSINSISQMRNALFLPYVKVENTNLYRQFIKNNRKIVLFENQYYRLEIMDHLLSQIHRDITPLKGRGYLFYFILTHC